MKKIGSYILIKAAEFLAIEKAHKLARTLTENQIDDILASKKHIHANPLRKLRVVASDQCQANVAETYLVKGE